MDRPHQNIPDNEFIVNAHYDRADNNGNYRPEQMFTQFIYMIEKRHFRFGLRVPYIRENAHAITAMFEIILNKTKPRKNKLRGLNYLNKHSNYFNHS